MTSPTARPASAAALSGSTDVITTPLGLLRPMFRAISGVTSCTVRPSPLLVAFETTVFSSFSSAVVTRSVISRLSRNTLTGTVLPDCGLGDEQGQFVRALDVFAVVFDD